MGELLEAAGESWRKMAQDCRQDAERTEARIKELSKHGLLYRDKICHLQNILDELLLKAKFYERRAREKERG